MASIDQSDCGKLIRPDVYKVLRRWEHLVPLVTDIFKDKYKGVAVMASLWATFHNEGRDSVYLDLEQHYTASWVPEWVDEEFDDILDAVMDIIEEMDRVKFGDNI